MVEARRVLGEVAPEFQQTWETRFLAGLCRRKALPLMGHTSSVLSLAYSPGGKRIVTASQDQTVKVWDAETGQEKLSLKGFTSPVTSVGFSPDGSHIVAGSYDGTAKVWSARGETAVLSLKGPGGALRCVAFNPEGQEVFAQDSTGGLLAWDTSTGKPLPPPVRLTLSPREATSPDGRLCAAIEGETVRLTPVFFPLFNSDWHQEHLAVALRARDDFAAAFHRSRLDAEALSGHPYDAGLHVA